MSSRRARSGPALRPTGREPLELRQLLFLEPPPGQPERLLSALRTLFRDHLEEGLASGPDSSVDQGAVDAEPA